MIKVIEKRLKQSSYQTHDITDDASQINGFQNNQVSSSGAIKLPIYYKENPLYTHRFLINSNDSKNSFFQCQQSSDEATCSTLTNNTPINKRISNISQFKYETDETLRIRKKNRSLFSQQKDSARTPSCQQIASIDFTKNNLLEEIQNMDSQTTEGVSCYSPINISKRNNKQFKLDGQQSIKTNTKRLNSMPKEQKYNFLQSDKQLSTISFDENNKEFLSSNSLRMKKSSRLLKTNDNTHNVISSSMNIEVPMQDSNCLSNRNQTYNHGNNSSNMSEDNQKQSYMQLIFNEQARTMNNGNFQDYLCYLSQQNLTVKQKNKKHTNQHQSNTRQRRPVNDTNDNEISLNQSQKLIQLSKSHKSIPSQKDLSLTNLSPVPYIQSSNLDSNNNLSALISNKKRLSIRLQKLEKDNAELLLNNKKDSIFSPDTIEKMPLNQHHYHQNNNNINQNQQKQSQNLQPFAKIPSISVIETKKSNLMALKPIQLKKIMEPQKTNKAEEFAHKFDYKEDSPTTKNVHFVTSIQNIDINEDSTQETNKQNGNIFQRRHKRNNTFSSSPNISLNSLSVTLKKEKSLISEKTERSPIRMKSMIDTQSGSIKKNSIIGQVKALNFAHRLIQLKDMSKATQNIQKQIRKMIDQIKQLAQLPKIYHNKSYNFVFDLWSRFPELKNIFLNQEKQIIKTPINVTPKQVQDAFKLDRLKAVYNLDKNDPKMTYDQVLEKYLHKDFQIYITFIEEFNMKIQQNQLKNLEKQIIDQQNTINQLEQKMSYNLLCNPNQSQTSSATYAFKEDYNNNLKSFLERGTYLLSKQSDKFEMAEKKYGNFDNINLKSKYFGGYISSIYENILKNKRNQNKFANVKHYSEDED